MTAIWNASAVTPLATDRIPVDVSAAGAPSRWTGQNIADINTIIGGTVTALGSIGTNTALNLALGGYFSATITGNLTFSITNVPASAGVTFVLTLTNGGAFTVTLPGSVTIIGGSPVLSAAGTDWLVFRTLDGGTAWTLEVVGNPRDADLATWATITPGAGVATALGVNTGTAGAVVVNGGALGTPSSATLTNATGLPPAGITQSGATSNQVLAWNGSAWAPATSSGASPGGSGSEVQYRGSASTFSAAAGTHWDSTNGRLSIGAGTSPAAVLHVAPDSASEIPMIAQGAASQTANLQDWRNSAGSVVASILSDGRASFPTGSYNTPNIVFSGSNGIAYYLNGIYFVANGGNVGYAIDGYRCTSGGHIGWTSNSSFANGSADLRLSRAAAAIAQLNNGSTGGAALEFIEQTAPGSPGANKARIYAEDNGSGKTRIMALFPSGASQQIAIEP